MSKLLKNLPNKTVILPLIGKEMFNYEDFEDFNKKYGEWLIFLGESPEDWWFEYTSKYK